MAVEMAQGAFFSGSEILYKVSYKDNTINNAGVGALGKKFAVVDVDGHKVLWARAVDE
jgi:hypothetical protein